VDKVTVIDARELNEDYPYDAIVVADGKTEKMLIKLLGLLPSEKGYLKHAMHFGSYDKR
jgi:hypothetical protein